MADVSDLLYCINEARKAVQSLREGMVEAALAENIYTSRKIHVVVFSDEYLTEALNKIGRELDDAEREAGRLAKDGGDA